MENRNRRKLVRPIHKTVKARRNPSSQWVFRSHDSQPSGFASSTEFITAVSKIYHQEENDIERFLKFAGSYKAEKK